MRTDRYQEERIEELYRKMYAVLFTYAKSVLNNPSLAEEAVQDAFCIACEKRYELLKSKSPEGWLMNTLKYVVQNTLRQREKMGRLVIKALNAGETMQPAAPDDEAVDILYEDIFEDEDFRLFKRVALDGRSMREASDEIGITLENCKKKIQRARLRLQIIFSNGDS